MVRTSKTREYTQEELETLELVARLTRMPGFERLGELVKEAQQQYFANLAKGIASNPGPVDQREIDYKRGFWQGAVWALKALPKIKTAEWDKFVNQEDDSPE